MFKNVQKYSFGATQNHQYHWNCFSEQLYKCLPWSKATAAAAIILQTIFLLEEASHYNLFSRINLKWVRLFHSWWIAFWYWHVFLQLGACFEILFLCAETRLTSVRRRWEKCDTNFLADKIHLEWNVCHFQWVFVQRYRWEVEIIPYSALKSWSIAILDWWRYWEILQGFWC